MPIGEKRLGFIGAGAMGSALMKGVLERGILPAAQVYVSDPDGERVKLLVSQLGINSVQGNEELVKEVDVVVLAVKPQIITTVLEELKGKWSSSQLVISIAAGITLGKLEGLLGDIPVARVMPNTPCLVGAGAAGIALGGFATPEHGQLAQEIFAAVGEAFLLPEELLDAVTGLSGSGPAYCYLFIEALADAGVREGLPRKVAQRLAAMTLKGSAQMVLDTNKHPGELKDMVTSPAGTTIEAVSFLEDRAFRGTVMAAVRNAARRSREMGE
ncbi:MAG: pyrroline-5-carboxylate reductase [Firmicutes bacterium]|nr:pyrroline-5-carboxylate reductase [Bacillota bacterium]